MTAATQRKTIKPLFIYHCLPTIDQLLTILRLCVCVWEYDPLDACVYLISVRTNKINHSSVQELHFIRLASSLVFYVLDSASVAGVSGTFGRTPPQPHASPFPPPQPLNWSTSTWLPSGWAHTGFRLSSLQASAGRYEKAVSENTTWPKSTKFFCIAQLSPNTFTALLDLSHCCLVHTEVGIFKKRGPPSVSTRWPIRSLKKNGNGSIMKKKGESHVWIDKEVAAPEY